MRYWCYRLYIWYIWLYWLPEKRDWFVLFWIIDIPNSWSNVSLGSRFIHMHANTYQSILLCNVFTSSIKNINLILWNIVSSHKFVQFYSFLKFYKNYNFDKKFRIDYQMILFFFFDFLNKKKFILYFSNTFLFLRKE